jgi:hypothetical protein
MEEDLKILDEVVVKAYSKNKTINDLATISARTFSMEEVNRYAGGRGDPARLAANFAGVSAPDDSRNDIVIRGNSPVGVLWRIDGMNVTNPNHFATVGTTGGAVSALNTNLLKSSDFFTSAFPSEYGNAISGVFDLGIQKWKYPKTRDDGTSRSHHRARSDHRRTYQQKEQFFLCSWIQIRSCWCSPGSGRRYRYDRHTELSGSILQGK